MVFNLDYAKKPINKIVLGNSVPAAAGIRREQALIILTGCKGYVGGYKLVRLNVNYCEIGRKFLVPYTLR
jgi:hypothetical protein